MFSLAYSDTVPPVVDTLVAPSPTPKPNWQLTHIEGVITMQGEAPQEIIDILNRLYTKEK